VTSPVKTAQPKAPETDAEVNALLKRANRGDETCLPEVRAWLDTAPGLVEFNGSPARHLINDLVEGYSKDLVIREAARRKLAELRAGLEGPNPSPLERLLAERAAVCWFLVNRYESHYAKAKDINIRQAEFLQRRIDAAHRRFLSAVKTLATVRRLAVPVLQVNLARQQVNVAGAMPVPVPKRMARGTATSCRWPLERPSGRLAAYIPGWATGISTDITMDEAYEPMLEPNTRANPLSRLGPAVSKCAESYLRGWGASPFA
jgi:hypothetical protein